MFWSFIIFTLLVKLFFLCRPASYFAVITAVPQPHFSNQLQCNIFTKFTSQRATAASDSVFANGRNPRAMLTPNKIIVFFCLANDGPYRTVPKHGKLNIIKQNSHRILGKWENCPHELQKYGSPGDFRWATRPHKRSCSLSGSFTGFSSFNSPRLKVVLYHILITLEVYSQVPEKKCPCDGRLVFWASF